MKGILSVEDLEKLSEWAKRLEIIHKEPYDVCFSKEVWKHLREKGYCDFANEELEDPIKGDVRKVVNLAGFGKVNMHVHQPVGIYEACFIIEDPRYPDLEPIEKELFDSKKSNLHSRKNKRHLPRWAK